MTWVLDSGATEHQTCDRKLLHDVRILKQAVELEVAKEGHSMKATKSGHLNATSKVGDTISKIHMKNVLFVPESRRNLLSFSKLVQAGVEVRFLHPQKAYINKDGQTIGIAWCHNGIYEWKMRLKKN